VWFCGDQCIFKAGGRIGEFLYGEITYQIIGAAFEVWKVLG